jgi:signal peptidase II
MKWRHFYLLIILCVLIADQITKIVVSRAISPYTHISVIPGFFNLTHIHNRGAIFGFFSRSGAPFVSILLTGASLAALGFVIYYFLKTPSSEKMMKISLSLILGGALGNLVDRVFKGYVVDFADFYFRQWHWPAFNVADASITIGALCLIFVLLQGRPKCSPSSSK